MTPRFWPGQQLLWPQQLLHILKTASSSTTCSLVSCPREGASTVVLWRQTQGQRQGGVGSDGPASGCLCRPLAGTQDGQELVPNTGQTRLLTSHSSVFATRGQLLGFYFPVKLRLRARMGEGQGPFRPCSSRYRGWSVSRTEGPHCSEGCGCCVMFLCVFFVVVF